MVQDHSRGGSRVPRTEIRLCAEMEWDGLAGSGFEMRSSACTVLARDGAGARPERDALTKPLMRQENPGALGEIRTPDPQIRSLMLYPAELRAQQGDPIRDRPASVTTTPPTARPYVAIRANTP
jgi:hypothetical protein